MDVELEGKGSSLIHIAQGGGSTAIIPQSDFFFGDGDIDEPLNYDPLSPVDQNGVGQVGRICRYGIYMCML